MAGAAPPRKILEGTAVGVSDLLDRLSSETIMGVVSRIRRAEKEGLTSALCPLPHTFANTGGAKMEQVRAIVYGNTIEHLRACTEDRFEVTLYQIKKRDDRVVWELEVSWEPIIPIENLSRCTEMMQSVLREVTEQPPDDLAPEY
jgi:hypothetical protein